MTNIDPDSRKEAGICFFFEKNDIDVYSGRNIDLDAWNYACKIANISKAMIINRTDIDIKPFDANMEITIQTGLDPKSLKGHTTQLVTPWETADTTDLWDFDHKTDWYVFGPASGWDQYFGDTLLSIPQHGKGALHAVHVATTVMFHRYYTLWQ